MQQPKMNKDGSKNLRYLLGIVRIFLEIMAENSKGGLP